jgi:hypothetical protein
MHINIIKKAFHPFILSFAVGLVFTGCAHINLPQKQALPSEIPVAIEVPSTLRLTWSKVGDWCEIPAGRYSLVYENKKGYFFKSNDGKVIHSTVFGPKEAQGGIELSKDFGQFCLFVESSYKGIGELTAYMARKEQGDSDDTFRIPHGWVSNEQAARWVIIFK